MSLPIKSASCKFIYHSPSSLYYDPPHRAEALSDDACLTSVCLSVCLSDVYLSVAYIGPKSRTERPRKTKIGKEAGHVTRD